MLTARAFALGLRLYPADYTASFAAEMLTAFQEAAVAHRRRGRVCFTRFVSAEPSSLLWVAALEWIAKLTSDRTVRGRCLPDPRMMRPPGIARDDWLRNV